MEAVIALAIFVLVGTLAAWFDHDSRDGLRSKGHHLAAYGLTWGKDDEQQPSSSDARRPSHG